MKRDKILLLGYPNGFIGSVFNRKERIIFPLYKENEIQRSLLKKCVYRAQLSFHLPKINIWYGFKELLLENYNLIIILQCVGADKIIEYIRKKNNRCRIIYWLWDTVGTLKNPILYDLKKETERLLIKNNIEKYKYEIWSFDKNDCKKYNFFYNNQVSCKYQLKPTSLKYDVFFCGQNKGRLSTLLEIEQILNNKNISCAFLMKKESQMIINQKTNINFINHNIDYIKMLNYINKSKCIVDLVQKTQGGLTWRPLEAMFYKKKLITNFAQIIEYDFYNPKNIFIWGKDDINNIKEFIDSEYEDVPEEIVNKYTIDGWLNNFKQV